MRKLSEPEWKSLFYRHHFNEKGNALAAELIHEKLVELELLDAP